MRGSRRPAKRKDASVLGVNRQRTPHLFTNNSTRQHVQVSSRKHDALVKAGRIPLRGQLLLGFCNRTFLLGGDDDTTPM